jgi:DNA-binding Xre family transcriptional regulator
MSTEPVLDPCFFNEQLFMARTSEILGKDATVAERAAHAGLARSALNRLRAGDIGLSVRRAKAICRLLDVTVEELFPEADPNLAKTAA